MLNASCLPDFAMATQAKEKATMRLCESAIGKSGFTYFGGISISEFGILSVIIGFYVSVHYAHRYNDLLKELEHTQQ